MIRDTGKLKSNREISEGNAMVESDSLRYTKIPLNNGSGAIPALGFGTLIPDTIATKNATKAALEAGFRQLDTSERYRTEREAGEAILQLGYVDLYLIHTPVPSNLDPSKPQG